MSRANILDTRRAAIIEATIRVLARDGLAETTTRKISAEAGVNQAMLRYYFGSKDELLFAVLQEMMRLTAEIIRSVTVDSGQLHEIIAASLKAFWSHVEAAPELQIMQYELTLYALRNPESAWLAKQQYSGYSAVVETIFQQACAASSQTCITPLPVIARFVIGGLDGLILQFISDRDNVRARRDLDYLITAVVALTAAPP